MKNININVNYFKKAAMFMAGFSLFQCLRIALTASSFALKRFGIPRKNVDIFITKIHNSMEVAIFTGILIATLYVVLIPRRYAKYNSLISVFTNWLVCILFFVVLVAYGGHGEMGDLTTYYWGLVFSGFAMGMNQSIVMAVSVENISYFAGAIPFAGVQVSLYHILFLYYNRGRPNYDLDYWILVYQIIIAIVISGTAAILWTIGFVEDHKVTLRNESLEEGSGEEVKIIILDSGKEEDNNRTEETATNVELTTHQKSMTENSTVELGTKGLTQLIKRSTEFLKLNFKNGSKKPKKPVKICKNKFRFFAFLQGIYRALSPIMMSTVAMGVVYLVFPAIAPYRLTNLDTAHKIDIVILITFVAPALINIALCAFKVGPNCDWSEKRVWNYVWLFVIPYFGCIIMFFIPVHYPDCKFSKLMTGSRCVLSFVCFIFALSHAVLKTVGFTGAGVQNTIKPKTITNTDLDINKNTTSTAGVACCNRTSTATAINSTSAYESSTTNDGITSGNFSATTSTNTTGTTSGKTKRAAKNTSRGESSHCEGNDNSLNGQVSSFNILLSYFVLVIFAFLSDGYLKTVKMYEANRDLWPTANMGAFCSFGFWISRSFRRGMVSFGEVFTLNVREQLMK